MPARDEQHRIAPLLSTVVSAPGVDEVVVVDDQSNDGTADLARSMGASVVRGHPLPIGWAGKAWAMDQGLRAATGDWIVFLDADTRPDPELPRALVGRAITDGLDLVTAAGRFDCPTFPLTWLHPAMLTTLVYRYGPPGAPRRPAPSCGAIARAQWRAPGSARRRLQALRRPHHERLLANGQCLAVRRELLLAAGGMAVVSGHTVEDVALARHLAAAGWQIAFLDASALLTVRMYESAGEAWRGWGRSLALPGVDPLVRQLSGLGMIVAAQALPLVRVLLRRGDVIDGALLVMRLGVLAGTAQVYERRGLAYWASPVADVVAAAALARGIIARRQRWRGRIYTSR